MAHLKNNELSNLYLKHWTVKKALFEGEVSGFPLETMPVAAGLIDVSGRIVNGNTQFLAILDKPPIPSDPIYLNDFFEPATKTTIFETIRRCITHPEKTRYLSLRKKSTRTLWFHAAFRVFAVDSHHPVIVLLLIPQKGGLFSKFNKSLTRSFKQLSQIHLCWIVIQHNRKIVETDHLASDFLGMAASQLIGLDFAKLFANPFEGLKVWSSLKAGGIFQGKVLITRGKTCKGNTACYLFAARLPYLTARDDFYLLWFLNISPIDSLCSEIKATDSYSSQLIKPLLQAIDTIAQLQLRGAEMRYQATVHDLTHQHWLETLNESEIPILMAENHSIYFVNSAFKQLMGIKENDVAHFTLEADWLNTNIKFQPDFNTLLETKQLPARAKATALKTNPPSHFDVLVTPYWTDMTLYRIFFMTPSHLLSDSEISSEQKERLASLGQISTIIAHEIRNPLGSIRLNLQYLFQRMSIPDEYKKAFKDIEMGIYRIEKVIQSILDFTRPKSPDFQLLCLHEIIQSRVTAFRNEIEETAIPIETHFKAKHSSILGDPNMLDRVFANLISNACEAIEGKGVIRIETENKNNSIWVSIHDTGRGMPPEVLSKIYRPFFTTKSDGVGIGLAIVRRILDLHQADIQVQSRVGQGTTFILRFKLMESGEA